MTGVSAGFRPPCWCPCRWAPTWRFHTNLYGENVSAHIFHKKNCCDLNLGQSLCIITFFLFPYSGLNLLNGFVFFVFLIYFEWCDTENQQYLPLPSPAFPHAFPCLPLPSPAFPCLPLPSPTSPYLPLPSL